MAGTSNLLEMGVVGQFEILSRVEWNRIEWNQLSWRWFGASCCQPWNLIRYAVPARQMSKTLYVRFRDRGFWAFDVISAVFLKHLIDAASPKLGQTGHERLSKAIEHWRVNAVTSDFGLFLDSDWSPSQIQEFTTLANAACDALSERSTIPAEEIASWLMINDRHIFPRGLPFVTTASVVRLGRAILHLVNGSLPEPPSGTWWFFGTEDAPPTLQKWNAQNAVWPPASVDGQQKREHP